MSEVKADGGGLRYDAGKNRLDLLPPEWIWELGLVMTAGAAKYDARNWERGMAKSKMLGCALRHIYKRVFGERVDAETGRPHLALAAWNLLAWMTYDQRGIGEDDIPTGTRPDIVVSRDPLREPWVCGACGWVDRHHPDCIDRDKGIPR